LYARPILCLAVPKIINYFRDSVIIVAVVDRSTFFI
jgi:hypothetical protein